MHDVMRKRLWRKLETLPDDQLYQVLDFIEFLESKYAQGQAPEPNGIQRFAERLEDRMRVREVAPRAMTGTMKLLGTAGRVLDNLTEVGQGLVEGLKAPSTSGRPAATGPARMTGSTPGATRMPRGAHPRPLDDSE